MLATATFQRHTPSGSHKAAAHCATWNLVIQSFCSCIRWPYCFACWVVHSQIQHCCFEQSYRWGGKFPILKCEGIAWSQRFTITSQLREFHMEHISAGASGFVCWSGGPASRWIWISVCYGYTIYFFSFFLTVFPSIITNTSSYLSLEYSSDWCKSPNLISCQSRIRMPKPRCNSPHPPLVLPSHCSFPLFVLLPEGFSSHQSPIGQKRHIARKAGGFLFHLRSNSKCKCHSLDLFEKQRLPQSFWAIRSKRKAEKGEQNAGISEFHPDTWSSQYQL